MAVNPGWLPVAGQSSLWAVLSGAGDVLHQDVNVHAGALAQDRQAGTIADADPLQFGREVRELGHPLAIRGDDNVTEPPARIEPAKTGFVSARPRDDAVHHYAGRTEARGNLLAEGADADARQRRAPVSDERRNDPVDSVHRHCESDACK